MRRITSPRAFFRLVLLLTQMAASLTCATDAERPPLTHTVADKEKASMVLIAAGPFTMGRDKADPDEQPTHRVSLDAFYIDRYEVTVEQYAKFLTSQDAELPLLWQEARRGENHEKPVVGVDWYDATEYCQWANKRLPTEAEWEKAARGADGRLYPWGNDPPTRDHATFAQEAANGYAALRKVGSFGKGQSPYGVYDLAGSLWEWVADRYDEHYYAQSPEHNPRGPATGPLRVLRGGAWNSPAMMIVSANRNAHVPSARRSDIGFRCAKDSPRVPR